MPDIQLGAHTVRSHGTKVLRFHMHDWIILVLLGVTDIILNVIDPFHRFVGKDMLTDLKYPFKGNTIPFWAVPLIGILLPFVIFTAIYFKRRNVYDLHHAILVFHGSNWRFFDFTTFHGSNRVKKKFMVALRDFGLLFSVLITAVLTDAIKDAVGRPRPDFFWRCFPDGNGVFDKVTSNVMCNGKKSDIKEGHKSFPSGHSSWSFAGLGFLSWYLAGKIRAFDRQGHVAKLCLVFLPLLCAALVAVSRVDDYWHHWQDVFAGGLLGLVVASFCYLQFFPPPYHVDGWGPHAYFHSLEDTQSNGEILATTVNQRAPNPRPVEIEAASVPSEHQNQFGMRYSSSALDAMESGRRY